jgi:hypothetical protein
MNGEMQSGFGFDESTSVTHALLSRCGSVVGEDSRGGQR